MSNEKKSQSASTKPRTHRRVYVLELWHYLVLHRDPDEPGRVFFASRRFRQWLAEDRRPAPHRDTVHARLVDLVKAGFIELPPKESQVRDARDAKGFYVRLLRGPEMDPRELVELDRRRRAPTWIPDPRLPDDEDDRGDEAGRVYEEDLSVPVAGDSSRDEGDHPLGPDDQVDEYEPDEEPGEWDS